MASLRAALLLVLPLAVACSKKPTFEFALPSGKELVISFSTSTEKRRPDGKVDRDSSTLINRLKISAGGTVGSDTINMSSRITRVIVDRRPFMADANVVWDSDKGPPPSEEFELDALMLGLSYDVLMRPDFTAIVSSVRWPDPRPGTPSEAAMMKELLTPKAIAADLTGSFRALPRGKREVGSNWRGKTQVSSPLTQEKTELTVWWKLESYKDGVAVLAVDIDTPPSARANIIEHKGQLTYDVANKLPLQQTTTIVAEVDVGGDTYTVTTEQTASYAIE
jgi:hypothetical protein